MTTAKQRGEGVEGSKIGKGGWAMKTEEKSSRSGRVEGLLARREEEGCLWTSNTA